jgi:heterodisulfide reductase subunit C
MESLNGLDRQASDAFAASAMGDNRVRNDLSRIEELAHTQLSDCYQCGKCAAGCPVGEHMDVLPNRLIRLVQLGRIDQALAAQSIWQCVSCMTCATRCPKSVNCTGVLDALRQLSVEQARTSPAQRRTVLFQQAFLQNIRRNGRLNELELIGMFKTRGFLGDLNVPFLFKDSMLAPRMMRRGKFHLTGEKVRDREVVRRMFERCMNGSEDDGD